MREAVIVEALRTPIGKRGGGLSGVRAEDLAAVPVRAVVERASIPPTAVDDVLMGCVTQVGEQGWNIGRLAALIAGLGPEVPGVALNRMCGSSQQAVHFASQAIIAGDADVVIAAGVESMSRVPMLSDGKDISPALAAKYEMIWQGEAAERVAERWGISRSEQDAYALESHRRAVAAMDEGRFDREIVPVENVAGTAAPVVHDEAVRRDSSLDRLGGLKPVFRETGVITAGNASQIVDGASAVLLMSREKAREFGLRPRARVLARAVVGVDPTLMLHGVIPATVKVLERAGLSMDQIDLFEINEAFAAVVLAWQKALNLASLEKVNVNGGAIALGHPLGASGARLMTTLLHELERRELRYGLQAMCIGHGMATATIIERESF